MSFELIHCPWHHNLLWQWVPNVDNTESEEVLSHIIVSTIILSFVASDCAVSSGRYFSWFVALRDSGCIKSVFFIFLWFLWHLLLNSSYLSMANSGIIFVALRCASSIISLTYIDVGSHFTFSYSRPDLTNVAKSCFINSMSMYVKVLHVSPDILFDSLTAFATATPYVHLIWDLS